MLGIPAGRMKSGCRGMGGEGRASAQPVAEGFGPLWQPAGIKMQFALSQNLLNLGLRSVGRIVSGVQTGRGRGVYLDYLSLFPVKKFLRGV